MENDVSLIGILTMASLAPFLIACGTCFIKISIVFVMVRNALGLQQIPSNMTLNGIALVISVFIMMPVVKEGYAYYLGNKDSLTSVSAYEEFFDNGFTDYKTYLERYSDPDLVAFFEKAKVARMHLQEETPAESIDIVPEGEEPKHSLLTLLPAYALSEIKDAFKIGFYIYLPFVVIDMLVSSILLTLGMMMMSPVTISVPIKLLLFVVLDGWTLISKGLIEQYLYLGG